MTLGFFENAFRPSLLRQPPSQLVYYHGPSHGNWTSTICRWFFWYGQVTYHDSMVASCYVMTIKPAIPMAKLVDTLTSHYLFLQSGSSKWSFEHHSRIGLQTPTRFGRKNYSHRLSQKKKTLWETPKSIQLSLETSQKAGMHPCISYKQCYKHHVYKPGIPVCPYIKCFGNILFQGLNSLYWGWSSPTIGLMTIPDYMMAIMGV